MRVIAILPTLIALTAALYQKSYNGNAPELGHIVGAAVGSAWQAPGGIAGGDYVVYGPYASDFTVNTKMCTWFYLSIGDVSTDKLGVISLDVVTDLGATILGDRYLLRNWFSAPGGVQVFPVCYQGPAATTPGIEYRVWTHGVTTVTVQKIEVTDCGWPEGYVRSYSPAGARSFRTAGIGVVYGNNQGWDASSSTTGVMTDGPVATDIPPGRAMRAHFLLAVGAWAPRHAGCRWHGADACIYLRDWNRCLCRLPRAPCPQLPLLLCSPLQARPAPRTSTRPSPSRCTTATPPPSWSAAPSSAASSSRPWWRRPSPWTSRPSPTGRTATRSPSSPAPACCTWAQWSTRPAPPSTRASP